MLVKVAQMFPSVIRHLIHGIVYNLLEAIVEVRIQTSLHRLKGADGLDELVQVILYCC